MDDAKNIQDLIQAVARLEALVETERRETAELRVQLGRLIEGFAAQQAKVETFWTNGKGREWDDAIRANTAAITRLNDRLAEAERDRSVSKAKAAGVLFGAGAAGGGLAELIRSLWG